VINGLFIIEFGAGVFLLGITPWLAPSILVLFLLSIGASAFLPAYLTMVAR